MNKALILCLSFACSVFAGNALAADDAKKAPSPAQQAQQERMKSCNKDAKDKALKGDERKAFMSNCLSGKTESAAPAAEPATQQNKMKTCNKEAGDKALKGDERKKFMSDCLKG